MLSGSLFVQDYLLATMKNQRDDLVGKLEYLFMFEFKSISISIFQYVCCMIKNKAKTTEVGNKN